MVDPNEGFQQDITSEDFPRQLNIVNEETLNKNETHNAWIIIGRDRWGDLGDGYGNFPLSQGGDKCSTIDIFVGMDSYEAGSEKSNKDTRKIKNTQKDASRLYISQKTDIDAAFQILEAGDIKPSYGRAAIGIKSDNLRFIARESIKLIANCGDPNTVTNKKEGSVSDKIYGIELIGGPKTKPGEMQRIVKAKNLELCLTDIINYIDNLHATFMDYVNQQKIFNDFVSKHTHQGAINAGPTGTTFTINSMQVENANLQLTNFIDKNTNFNISKARGELHSKIVSSWLKDTDSKYIGSFYNKTN